MNAENLSEAPDSVDRSGVSDCYAGSRFLQHGPVMLGCITPDARDLLDDIMAAYRDHYDPKNHTSDPDAVYQFAYWLVRWSGLIQRAATPRTEPDERKDEMLWATCPGCGKRDNTGLPGEVLTGVIHCGYCGTVSCNHVPA
jgi:hypothetical protein